jgi:hypothetical protein
MEKNENNSISGFFLSQENKKDFENHETKTERGKKQQKNQSRILFFTFFHFRFDRFCFFLSFFF